MAWEPISYDSSFATFICAEEWLVPMAVHSVCLALMAKKASRGRKLEILTGGDLAFVWLEMRVHKFIIVALELLGPMLAICLWLVLPWAVIKPIGMRSHIMVQWMLPGSVVLVET